jgi:hypothetical protein
MNGPHCIALAYGNQSRDRSVLVCRRHTLGAELQWMHGCGNLLITGPFSSNISELCFCYQRDKEALKIDFSDKFWWWSFFPHCGAATQRGSWPPHSWGFLDYTQQRITVGRTPLDEWSARRRYLYLTVHNTHNTQTSMQPLGFEPTVSADERPQTYALDRAATGSHGKAIMHYRNVKWIAYEVENLTVGELQVHLSDRPGRTDSPKDSYWNMSFHLEQFFFFILQTSNAAQVLHNRADLLRHINCPVNILFIKIVTPCSLVKV